MDVHPAAIPADSRIGRSLKLAIVALVVLLTMAGSGVADASPGGHGASEGVSGSAAPGEPRGGPPVTVMTRNIYLGSELGPIFAAASPEGLVGATTQTWLNVLASDFPARADLLADEVARDMPLIIGLQEVSLWRTGRTGEVAENVALDFLDILLDAFAARGLHYETASVYEAFDGQLPAINPATGGLFEVRLTDRDAILVRSDVPPAQLTVLHEETGLFDAALELPVLGQPLRVDRGWNLIDVRVRNRTFRVVNSHFEAFDLGEVIRVQQAQELLDGPLDTDLPVVLLGDFNSNANMDGLAYELLVKEGGFEDAWSTANPDDPGLTCCHDADLKNDEVDLRSRIDLILVRDGVRVRDAEVIGIDPTMRTPSGLWPSDHAGVVARLMITGR